MDYAKALKEGLIRKPSNFICTISDDRGEELLYGKMPISEVFKKDIGIGGVLSILWFKRQFPTYATKFIEMTIMVTADHGPAVSGAHNAIVAARAGKDSDFLGRERHVNHRPKVRRRNRRRSPDFL